jgi:hypothetical protein
MQFISNEFIASVIPALFMCPVISTQAVSVIPAKAGDAFTGMTGTKSLNRIKNF